MRDCAPLPRGHGYGDCTGVSVTDGVTDSDGVSDGDRVGVGVRVDERDDVMLLLDVGVCVGDLELVPDSDGVFDPDALRDDDSDGDGPAGDSDEPMDRVRVGVTEAEDPTDRVAVGLVDAVEPMDRVGDRVNERLCVVPNDTDAVALMEREADGRTGERDTDTDGDRLRDGLDDSVEPTLRVGDGDTEEPKERDAVGDRVRLSDLDAEEPKDRVAVAVRERDDDAAAHDSRGRRHATDTAQRPLSETREEKPQTATQNRAH
jgi:hypothetical protein